MGRNWLGLEQNMVRAEGFEPLRAVCGLESLYPSPEEPSPDAARLVSSLSQLMSVPAWLATCGLPKICVILHRQSRQRLRPYRSGASFNTQASYFIS